MMRLEIIANNAVEENILDVFKEDGIAKFYTKIPNVHGVGKCGQRMGDAIWPEENFVFVIWCEAEEAERIALAIERVKKQFPNEGIKLFGLNPPTAPALPDAVSLA